MKKTKGEQCSKMIFEGRGWNHLCNNKAIIERDGKLYCKIHDPEYVKEKNAKLQAKWNVASAKRDEHWHRESVINSIFVGIDTAFIEKNIDRYKEMANETS